VNPQSKKFVALFIIFSLITINCASLKNIERKRKIAKRKHGVLLLITKKDNQQIRGELVAAKTKQKSLLLLESEAKADVSVDIKDIKVIKIIKKSKAPSVASVGFLVGALLGAAVGKLYEVPIISFNGVEGGGDGSKVLLGALIGGCIGALIGGAVGAGYGIDKTIRIEGKSDLEINEILEKLGRKARIPNYR